MEGDPAIYQPLSGSVPPPFSQGGARVPRSVLSEIKILPFPVDTVLLLKHPLLQTLVSQLDKV